MRYTLKLGRFFNLYALSAYYLRSFVKLGIELLFHGDAFYYIHVVYLVVLDSDYAVAYALLKQLDGMHAETRTEISIAARRTAAAL